MNRERQSDKPHLHCSTDDIEYDIIWEARKNIYLKVYEDGKIQVSVPLRCKIEDAEKLISDKKAWISKKLSVMQRRSVIKSGLYPKFTDNEILNFYNEKLILKLIIDPGRNRSIITREGNSLIVKLPLEDKEHILGMIKSWYIHEGKRIITERADFFAGLMGVDYGKITVKDQKSRWGSCSSKGNLNFCWKLLLMPEKLLDYVVVHELAHRHDIGHTRIFWAKVAEILPDYKLLDHELNKY